jgi:hypothetical protein
MGNVCNAVEGYMPFLEIFPNLLSLWGVGGVWKLYPHCCTVKLRFEKIRGGLPFGGKFCRRFHQVTDKHHRQHLARPIPSACVSRNAGAA